eukprot:9221148-Ditylum_brightwellii.AAC.1
MKEEKDNEKNALLEKDHVEDESILSTSDNIDDNENNGTCHGNNNESIPVPKRPSRVPFLMRKREAIYTLLDFDLNTIEEKSAASSIANNFGYIASTSDPDITCAIWHHQ